MRIKDCVAFVTGANRGLGLALARALLARGARKVYAGYTNASRVELRGHGIQTLALHVGFLDTDMTHGFEMRKTSPVDVVRITLDALEAGSEEVFGDEGTARLKESLSRGDALYLNPPEIA